MRILTAEQIKRAESNAFERYFTEAQLMKERAKNALIKSLSILVRKYAQKSFRSMWKR